MPIYVSEEAYGAEILLEVRTTRDSILSNPDLSPVPVQGQWSTQSPSATLGRQRVSGVQLINWVMASPTERRLSLAIRFLVLTALTSAQSEDVVSVLKFLCGFLDDKRCWRVVTLELTETLTHLDQLTVDAQRYLFSSNIIPATVLALVLLEARSSVEDELECLTESETEEGEVNGGLRTISGWIGTWKSRVIDRAVASIDAQDCVDNFLSRLLATADLHPPQAPLTFSTQFVLNLVASEELQKLLHTKPNSAGSVACFCLDAIKQLLGFANVQVYLNAATTQVASTSNPFFEDEPSDVLRRKTSAALSKLTALQPPLKALKDCFEYLWAHFRPVICRQVGRLLPFFLAQVST
ncbi:MAG: hypothetical protein KVP17_003015, partial [Porospora cf. gigantea B]|uniref:uncharacterized protein n=1 Tax=Porospora cf. gigantea B TaxID=2853592 RepID=UPI003571C624